MRRTGLCWAAAALSACSAPLELSVDARTDVDSAQFDAVVVTVVGADGSARGPMRRASADADFARGARVADVAGLPSGPTRVQVVLELAGSVVLERAVELNLDADHALTVTLDQVCMGLVCDGDAPECAAGQCVPAACGGGVPGACGARSCRLDAECEAVPGCVAARCEHAACICDAVPDAGACECEGTETGDETRACGCGAGSERRTRSCGGCTWAAWSEWAGCSAECVPGDADTQTEACGNCGERRRTRACGPSCGYGEWGEWSTCGAMGECAPGATRSGCDPCGHEVCSAGCTWGTCEPYDGFACLRVRPGTAGPPGNNYQCCGAGQWQFCLETCQWSIECEACDECSC